MKEENEVGYNKINVGLCHRAEILTRLHHILHTDKRY